MTIRPYRCESCNLRFWSDLEVGPDLIELSTCPCCAGCRTVVQDGPEIPLCGRCADTVHAADPDDRAQAARVC